MLSNCVVKSGKKIAYLHLISVLAPLLFLSRAESLRLARNKLNQASYNGSTFVFSKCLWIFFRLSIAFILYYAVKTMEYLLMKNSKSQINTCAFPSTIKWWKYLVAALYRSRKLFRSLCKRFPLAWTVWPAQRVPSGRKAAASANLYGSLI